MYSVPLFQFLRSAERRPLYITTVENVGVVLKTSARWTMDLRPGTEDMWLKEFSRSNKYIAMIMRVLLIFFCWELFLDLIFVIQIYVDIYLFINF